MMITAARGTIRHTWTVITEATASFELPSQWRLPWSRPSQRSVQSMGLNSESSIHSQAMAARGTGVVHGSRMRNRTIHLPRKSRVSTRARILARTSTRTMVTKVMKRLFVSERRKTGSFSTARKLRRPTKSYDASPTVTSLRL